MKRVTSITGVFIATAGLVLAALPAQATPSSGTPETELGSPATLVAPDVSVEYSVAEEPAIRPAAGETVSVTDDDGTTTTYFGVSAVCTESVSASAPRKESGAAKAQITYSRGTGCTGAGQGNGALQALRGVLPAWNDRSKHVVYNINPGIKVSRGLSWACPNSNSTKYRSQGWFGNAGGAPTNSAEVTLACGS